MEWHDEGTVIAARPFGETSAIVELITAGHGRHAGVVRGGASRKMAAMLQPGSQVSAVWRARLDDHLGSFTLEPLVSRAGLMADRLALAGLNAVCAMLRHCLAEREVHPLVYDRTQAVLAGMASADWAGDYLRWELLLLEEATNHLEARHGPPRDRPASPRGRRPQAPRSGPGAPAAVARYTEAVAAVKKAGVAAAVLPLDIGLAQEPGPFVVGPALEGESLAVKLAGGPLPWSRAVEIVASIATTLAAVASAGGPTHRALEPSAVWLAPDGAVLVLDYGVVAFGPAAPVHRGSHWLEYRAPEQLDGADGYARTDVFTLAGLLVELTTGVRGPRPARPRWHPLGDRWWREWSRRGTDEPRLGDLDPGSAAPNACRSS